MAILIHIVLLEGLGNIKAGVVYFYVAWVDIMTLKYFSKARHSDTSAKPSISV